MRSSGKNPAAFLWLPVLLLAACTADSPSPVLIPSNPAQAGFSSERLDRIDSVVSGYIDDGNIPGATALIARNGRIVYHKAFGWKDMENGEKMERDDIFRIASQTKALTSVAVMMLYEEGKFLLDDPISKYIPEFAHPRVLVKLNDDTTYTSRPAKREITIRDLLTHTSGICYPMFNPDVEPLFRKYGIVDGFVSEPLVLGNVMKKLGSLPLLHDPGEKWTYGLSTDLLGYFVEVVSGMSFDEFLKKRLFERLGMEDACFYLPEEKYDRLVPVYANTGEGLKRSDVAMYDYPVRGSTYFSGGAGLSCTILDYARFMQMMINDGSYNGHRFLSRKTIDLMTTNQAGDLFGDAGMGLGFRLETEKSHRQILGSVGNFSWGGYFSTSYWMDPEENLIGLFFCQMNPMDYGEIHQKFQVLTYQALVGE